MEIQGILTDVMDVEQCPGVLFYGIGYGFMHLRRVVLWSDIEKSRDVIFYGQGNRTIGIRYDETTNELLGVWIEE